MSNPQPPTIVAVATPPGRGAIGILRLSGPSAIAIADRCLVATASHSNAPDRKFLACEFRNEDGQPLDRCLYVTMRGPRSFTGEDVVEIHAHGGPHLLGRMLDQLIEAGAQPADPGEFSLRAFLNGKISLDQAEGISDIIDAETDRAVLAANRLLKGDLALRIDRISQEILSQRVLLEASIDFSEEEIDPYSPVQMADALSAISDEMRRIADGYDQGRLWRDGFRVVLAGAPNVGKSTLMNALLQTDRVLVSETPGTTRDAVSESLIVQGWKATLIDTAGLGDHPHDRLESMGMEVTTQQIQQADLIIAVLDATRQPERFETELISKWRSDKIPVLVALNKVDDPDQVQRGETDIDGILAMPISAQRRLGLERLTDALAQRFHRLGSARSNEDSAEILITRSRHRDAILDSSQSLDRCVDSLRNEASADCVAVDLQAAMDACGRISGRVDSDMILEEIFSRFCIGK